MATKENLPERDVFKVTKKLGILLQNWTVTIMNWVFTARKKTNKQTSKMLQWNLSAALAARFWETQQSNNGRRRQYTCSKTVNFLIGDPWVPTGGLLPLWKTRPLENKQFCWLYLVWYADHSHASMITLLFKKTVTNEKQPKSGFPLFLVAGLPSFS